MKKSKKKIIITAIVIVIFLVSVTTFMIKYIAINKMYPSPKIISWNLNQSFIYNKAEITGKKLTILDRDEFYDKYSLDANNFRELDAEMKMVLAEIQLTNITSEPISFNIFNFNFVARASNYWGNGLNPDYYDTINKDLGKIINLKSNETVNVILPYTAYDMQMFKKDWENFSDMKFDLILSYYPLMNIIHLN